MDELGKRIIEDKQRIQYLRQYADILDEQAKSKRREADEMERLLELARIEK